MKQNIISVSSFSYLYYSLIIHQHWFLKFFTAAKTMCNLNCWKFSAFTCFSRQNVPQHTAIWPDLSFDYGNITVGIKLRNLEVIQKSIGLLQSNVCVPIIAKAISKILRPEENISYRNSIGLIIQEAQFPANNLVKVTLTGTFRWYQSFLFFQLFVLKFAYFVSRMLYTIYARCQSLLSAQCKFPRMISIQCQSGQEENNFCFLSFHWQW